MYLEATLTFGLSDLQIKVISSLQKKKKHNDCMRYEESLQIKMNTIHL